MSLSVVFVLVGTSHPGNVGAAARAMKTMGFAELRLVEPCDHLGGEARARASGAEDVLERAELFDGLAAAVADCRTVIGTSARRREVSVPILDAREIGEELAALQGQAIAAGEPVRAAVLFGQERAGLDNDALDLCTRQLRIPCNPAFSSLNLGSAVQVVAYELSQALARVPSEPPEGPIKRELLPATSEAMEHFFAHLDRVMIATGFLDPAEPRQLRRRVRRYFERTRPTVNELGILRGVLGATEGARRRPGEARPGATGRGAAEGETADDARRTGEVASGDGADGGPWRIPRAAPETSSTPPARQPVVGLSPHPVARADSRDGIRTVRHACAGPRPPATFPYNARPFR